MTDKTKYTFKIADFTPDTLPFGRLIEYYAEIKKMIGLSEHLHLVEVFESSHASCLAADRRFEPQLRERLIELNEGKAPKSALRARDQINQMLREDGTSGEFFDVERANVIPFPGRQTDDNVLHSIRDHAVFGGELYHIAGTSDRAVKVRVYTENFGVVFCHATREMGVLLRQYLFEQVKIEGLGTWKRTTDGAWTVNDVSIMAVSALPSGDLRQTVNKLRALDIDWPENTLQEIDNVEERGGQIH